jgi:hypothetical protein
MKSRADGVAIHSAAIHGPRAVAYAFGMVMPRCFMYLPPRSA